jgi:hypothetical protein
VIQRRINNLAVGIEIATDCDRFRKISPLQGLDYVVVAMGRSTPMQGVGIVLGIESSVRSPRQEERLAL